MSGWISTDSISGIGTFVSLSRCLLVSKVSIPSPPSAKRRDNLWAPIPYRAGFGRATERIGMMALKALLLSESFSLSGSLAVGIPNQSYFAFGFLSAIAVVAGVNV